MTILLKRMRRKMLTMDRQKKVQAKDEGFFKNIVHVYDNDWNSMSTKYEDTNYDKWTVYIYIEIMQV